MFHPVIPTSQNNTPPFQNVPPRTQNLAIPGINNVLLEGEEIIDGEIVEKKARVNMLRGSGPAGGNTGFLSQMLTKVPQFSGEISTWPDFVSRFRGIWIWCKTWNFLVKQFLRG